MKQYVTQQKVQPTARSKISKYLPLPSRIRELKKGGESDLKKSINSNIALMHLLYHKTYSFQESMKLKSKIPANHTNYKETKQAKYAEPLLKEGAMEISSLAHEIIEKSILAGGKSTSIWNLAKEYFSYKRALCLSIFGAGTACAAGVMAFTGQLPIALGILGFSILASGITNEILRSRQNRFKEGLKLATKKAESN